MMIKRCLAVLLTYVMICTDSAFAADPSGKYEKMPEIFAVKVEEHESFLGEMQSRIYKEYLITTNPEVNQAIAQTADELESIVLPNVKPAKQKKGWKGRSMLNTVVIWYRTGDRFISTLTESCYEYKAVQQQIVFATGTYDLVSGEQIMLTDLFAADSPAWTLIENRVHDTLYALYPEEERDEAAIERLCSREALASADFTLSAMELTLHYYCSDVFTGKTNLMRVRFFYPEFEGMTTELGTQVMDNSRWKMVAVTCDDGPKDYASSKALDAFRKAGGRATYFNVGLQLDKYGYVFIRQQDQNFLFGNHTWSHYGGNSKVTDDARRKQYNKMTAAARKLVGEDTRYFRCPGGAYNCWIESGITAPIIQWSLDTKDFTGKKPKEIFKFIKENVKDGDIILVHDTGKYEHEAIGLYGPWLAENGYMMVTLDELAWAWDVKPESGTVYWSFRPGENKNEKFR